MSEETPRRVVAGLVGLGLASGGIALAVAAFSGGDTSGSVSSPVPGPTSTTEWTGPAPDPILDVDFDDVYRSDNLVSGRACCPIGVATQIASLLIEGAGLHLDPAPMISIGPKVPTAERTTILSLSQVQGAAEELRDKVFPGAEVRVGETRFNEDIYIEIGLDFVERHRSELAAYSHLQEFMDRRQQGRGAEAYISEDVAMKYEGGEDGLSLYEYANLPALDFQHMALTINSGLTEVALVPIWGETAYMDDDGPLVEILQVGWVRDPDAENGLRPSVVGVHRDTFPLPKSWQRALKERESA
jgi:hypothetical protein